MAFDLDERLLLERTLGDFLGDACSLERRRAALAADEPYDERNWRTLAEMGALALPIDESDGGLKSDEIVVTANDEQRRRHHRDPHVRPPHPQRHAQ